MANRADFAPELGALKSLRPFVFWAQTTLPTVFDDSLSYYEVLTKLCKMVNTLLENEDTNAENITALAEAYQELEDFTNNYFENLDVTQEISDKLDAMFNSGELGQIAVESASTILNEYLYGEDGESGKNKDINDMIAAANGRIDAKIAELNESSSEILGNLQTRVDAGIDNIPTVIEGWMNENLTIPSDIIIDDTLSIKDAAAEAYATGHLMDEVENLVLATSYWQNLNADRAAQNYITADIADGANPSVHTGAPAKTMIIANVTEGETVIISGVASAYSSNQYIPAFALANVTEDTGGNPYYEIKSVYPEGWDVDPEHPTGSNFKIIRNHTVNIPVTGDTFPINCVLIMEDATIPLSAKCSRLNMRTDDTLTSQSLPAQGKATGDAIDAKIPWPVTGGSKDVGTAGKRLASNGDGTTSWIEDDSGDLQNDVADLKSTLNFDNLLLGTDWLPGFIAATGSYSAGGTDRICTRFIPCPPGITINYIAETNHQNICGIAFYNKYTTFISGEKNNADIGTEASVTSPANTAYIRLSTKVAIKNQTYVKYAGNNSQVIAWLQRQITNLTVYVDKTNGNDNTGAGTSNSPYKTITKAISTGAKNICISPGIYTESVSASFLEYLRLFPNYVSFNSTSATDKPKVIIDGNGEIDTPLSLSYIRELYLDDIVVQNSASGKKGCMIDHCQHIELHNCEFLNNGHDGCVINYSNGVIRDCKANGNGNDGFNMNYFGDTQFINCSGHDNADDGISHHQGCTGYIEGGEWYGNGKGGVASPAHGSQVDIANVYCHDNAYGIYANADSGTVARTFHVWNSVLVNNSQYGITSKRNTAIMYNCKIAGNTVGQTTAPEGGSIVTL